MMKTSRNRITVMIMAFILVVPLIWYSKPAAVMAAASPSLVQTSVEIVGTGETFQLSIKDKVDKSTYSWTSSNTFVATVSSKGLVTSVNKGTATIKCKITYPTKKTKTLSCKVTVTIPANDIKINNAKLENGAHVMLLGESMDFNSDLTPENTSDQEYWSIGGGDAGCIRIDDEKSGRITAVKAGKVILTATAAKTATREAADLSIVNDAVIIEVVGPTATVKTADIVESNQIKVVFDSPVVPGTVINTDGTLSANIEVTMSRDTKGVVADDPGKLTASLSSDGKTLTITAAKSFRGFYGINFTDKIMTTTGVVLETYYTKITFTDVIPPDYAGTTLDDTGMIATINFNEPINFDHMVISDVNLITTTGETASAGTLNLLKNVMNYTVSTDKKSLTIDLTNIVSTDKGKMFTVVISGIKDMSGNLPVKVYVNALVRTDTSYKPQARLIQIKRTGYNTLTATFDRSIIVGGYAQVAGGSTIYGVPDIADSKNVNYTISDTEALYSGVKMVSVGSWNSYNVDPTDIYSNASREYPVDFTIDRSNPYIRDYSYDKDTGILTLTYTKDVTLTNISGMFSSSYTSVAEDIRTINLGYTVVTHSEGKNIIKLKLTNMSLLGDYTFTIGQGFVIDNYRNPSTPWNIRINNGTTALSELPEPYQIVQNSGNLSEVTVRFQYKLDKASAETVSNYKFTGLNIKKAELTDNNDETGGTVVLTLEDGSIEYNLSYPLTITGVKGFSNRYTAMTEYKTTVPLKENKRPVYNASEFDKTTKNNIKLNFNEAIQGSMTVRVSQSVAGMTQTVPVTLITVSGNSVIINLGSIPVNNGFVMVDVLSYDIKDVNSNALNNLPSRLPVVISY